MAGRGAALASQRLHADWPGNVRELESTIERAVALSDGGEIDVDDVAGLERPARLAVTSPGHRGHRSYRR
jgi:transcriptional regulator of acetoin/glycerol metabolism